MPKFPVSFLAIVLAGCASSGQALLEYDGHSTVSSTNPTVVDAVVTIRNRGSKLVNLRVPICPLPLEAYANADRSGQPIWRSTPRSCISDLMISPPIVVAPGDFYDFTLRAEFPSSMARQHVFLSMLIPGRLVPVGQLTVR